jgi:hypothetical protein
MIEFIGLSWDPRCLNQHLTKRDVIIHNSRWQIRQRISESISERWRNYEKFAGPLVALQPLKPGQA